MKWSELTVLQRIQFKDICDKNFGETLLSSESGEPIYFDEQQRLIDTSIVINLLLNEQLN
jgi:hypothetical protein